MPDNESIGAADFGLGTFTGGIVLLLPLNNRVMKLLRLKCATEIRFVLIFGFQYGCARDLEMRISQAQKSFNSQNLHNASILSTFNVPRAI